MYHHLISGCKSRNKQKRTFISVPVKLLPNALLHIPNRKLINKSRLCWTECKGSQTPGFWSPTPHQRIPACTGCSSGPHSTSSLWTCHPAQEASPTATFPAAGQDLQARRGVPSPCKRIMSEATGKQGIGAKVQGK